MGDEKHIVEQVETYIRQGGGEYEDWYVGIADNPFDPIDEATLFHKMQSHRFMYIETVSPQVAEAVAVYFVNGCGTDGNISENDRGGVCRALYVYKKAAHLVGYKTSDSVQSIC